MSDLLPTPLRRLRTSEEGQALVLAALGMIVLLMMAGLGVDVGYLKYQKQQMQKAADAGALAAASAMIIYSGQNGQTQIRTAGQSDAAANGFQDGQNGITVTVNNPPQTIGDPFVGKADYVEVIVSQARPTFFMRLAGYNSIIVSSRAVATAASSASGCVYTLSPTAAQDFVVKPGTQISANCGILVGSNSPTAFVDNSGLPNNVLASSVGIVGDCTGCSSWASQPTQGIAPFTDPLANLPAPTVPGCDHYSYTVLNAQNAKLSSGGYCGGITVAPTYNGPVTFGPGTYYLEGGGLQVFGTPTLTGNGVTFYNTNGTGGYQPIGILGCAERNALCSHQRRYGWNPLLYGPDHTLQSLEPELHQRTGRGDLYRYALFSHHWPDVPGSQGHRPIRTHSRVAVDVTRRYDNLQSL